MTIKLWRLWIALLLGPGLVWLVLGLLDGAAPEALAAGMVRYVAANGTNSGNGCTNSQTPCATVQHAVDVANSGDEIRVAAGTYTGVWVRDGVTQAVYVDKSLRLRGGFKANNWQSPDPLANPTTLDADGQGRVMVITGSITATVEGFHLTGGHALPNNCGGLCVVYADVTARNNTIFNNADNGVFVVFGRITLNNNSIYSNTAEYGGGVYLTSGGQGTLTGNNIHHNQARVSGGGIGVDYAATIDLANNTIRDNTADESGGGVYVYYQSRALLGRNDISGNSADNKGGGIFVSEATATISQSQVISNFAAAGGGGMWLEASPASLIDNHIANNVGLLMGGGVAISGSQTTLGENIIAGNMGGIGGGLYLQNNESTLTNTIIVENQASLAGSGLYGYGSLTRLFHTTLARNMGGDGSGIHLTHLGGSASAILTNTILVSHSVGVTVAAGSSAQLAATLWSSGAWANTVDWGGAGTIATGTINIRQEPGFISSQTGNYHLLYGSAALDQGVNAGVNQDIDGETRPHGGGYDLGADEGWPSLAIIKTSETESAWPGQPLTYTLHLTNTGYITLTPIITDILPTHVSPTGTLSWTPSLITPGGIWTQQIVVTVAPDYIGPLTNVVQVTSNQDAAGMYTHTLMIGHRYYFPLIFKDG